MKRIILLVALAMLAVTGSMQAQTPPPFVSIPDTLWFGSVPVGEERVMQVYLENVTDMTGRRSIKVAYSEPTDPAFTIPQSAPNPDGEINLERYYEYGNWRFDVHFTPSATGEYSGSTTLSCEGYTKNVHMIGTGVESNGVFSANTTIDFTDYIAGTRIFKPYNIENISDQEITVRIEWDATTLAPFEQPELFTRDIVMIPNTVARVYIGSTLPEPDGTVRTFRIVSGTQSETVTIRYNMHMPYGLPVQEIDFGTLTAGGDPVTIAIPVQNNTTADIPVQLQFIDQRDGFLLLDSITRPYDSIHFQYTPTEPGTYVDSLRTININDLGSTVEGFIVLRATVRPGTGDEDDTVGIVLKSASGPVGSIAHVGVQLNTDMPSNVAEMALSVRYNASVLIPQGTWMHDTIENGMRTTTFRFMPAARTRGSVITELPFQLALGDATASDMQIVKAEYFNADGTTMPIVTTGNNGVVSVDDSEGRAVNASAISMLLNAVPQPVRDVLNVTVRRPAGTAHFALYSASGKQVSDLSALVGSVQDGNVTVPMGSFAAGEYFLRLSVGSETIVLPVHKQ